MDRKNQINRRDSVGIRIIILRMKINDQYVDLQYFGEIKFYSNLIYCTNAVYLPGISYQKQLHLNRTCLIGANGPLLLTVPLIGGRDKKQKMKDARISYVDPWQRIHWRGINSAYRKAPWFEDYAPDLNRLFELKEKYLLDLNLKTTEWVIRKLKLRVDILAGNPVSANSGLDVATEKPEITFGWYQQVFEDRHGFIPNMGILDLLFCMGPSSKSYLEQCRQS